MLAANFKVQRALLLDEKFALDKASTFDHQNMMSKYLPKYLANE